MIIATMIDTIDVIKARTKATKAIISAVDNSAFDEDIIFASRGIASSRLATQRFGARQNVARTLLCNGEPLIYERKRGRKKYCLS
jgi:hypothetical protein